MSTRRSADYQGHLKFSCNISFRKNVCLIFVYSNSLNAPKNLHVMLFMQRPSRKIDYIDAKSNLKNWRIQKKEWQKQCTDSPVNTKSRWEFNGTSRNRGQSHGSQKKISTWKWLSARSYYITLRNVLVDSFFMRLLQQRLFLLCGQKWRQRYSNVLVTLRRYICHISATEKNATVKYLARRLLN